MPRPSVAPVRKQVSLAPELAKAVDEYRFANRFGSESEAIRGLIKLGLEAAAKLTVEPTRVQAKENLRKTR